MEVIKYREIYAIAPTDILVYDKRNNLWTGSTKCKVWVKLLQFFKGTKRATILTGRTPNGYSPFPQVAYWTCDLYEN